ncbi:MAG: hypothetical protein K0S12_1808 [Bacteroidetes bacterium]|jgi:hypothetical protein|nr:hypothetical protein [Bacteroidota bacterium]
MKKLVCILIVFFVSTEMFSQYGTFFRGIGVFGAATQSMHRYKNTDEDKKDFINDNPFTYTDSYYYPQTHYSREYFSWGAGIFAEFGNGDYGRWQTEFEYVNKGAKEMEVVDHFVGTRSGSYGVNKNTYIQWNNYLKYFSPFGLPSNFYLMPGIRLEYLFSSSSSVFTPVSGSFPKFWFSGNVGVGYEFPLFRRFSGLVEYHWNPDIIFHKTDNIKVRNRTFELRFGIIYRPRKRSIDDCNAPRYKGPAY